MSKSQAKTKKRGHNTPMPINGRIKTLSCVQKSAQVFNKSRNVRSREIDQNRALTKAALAKDFSQSFVLGNRKIFRVNIHSTASSTIFLNSRAFWRVFFATCAQFQTGGPRHQPLEVEKSQHYISADAYFGGMIFSSA